jgi:hypothetical protein
LESNTLSDGSDVAGSDGRARSPYILIDDVAARYRSSPRTIRERARLGQVPHLRQSFTRRLLFLPHELDLFDAGAGLETVQLPGGGRRVHVLSEGRRS